MKTLIRLAVFASILAAPLLARADQPGRHPAFLHALSDLRHARAYIERPARPEIQWDENTAIAAIDRAINEIKRAAIDDGKNLNDHPGLDANLNHRGRLQHSLELLRKAKRDIEEREDNMFAEGLRDRAIRHIDTAINFVEQAIANAHGEQPGPGMHPAFLHALTDLRHARAYLERPARPDIQWDENTAISAIDRAINEIKRAAIDDGKNLNDHPGLDANLNHRGRLQHSLELLRKAKRDIEEREDNMFAEGLRDRAIRHIDTAINFVEQAIANAHRR